MLHSLVSAIQAISGKNTQYTGTFDLLVSLLSDYETSNEVLVLKMIGNSLIAAPCGLSRSSTWAVFGHVALPWLSQSPHSGSREPVAQPVEFARSPVCCLCAPLQATPARGDIVRARAREWYQVDRV